LISRGEQMMPKLVGVMHGELSNDDLTGKVIGACFDIANELGHGFLEGVYLNALMVALHERGLRAQRQVPLKVRFHDIVVGEFFADIVVEDEVILELKSVDCLVTEHQAQLINYLTATGFEVGLLINFGQPKLEYKRCRRRQTQPPKPHQKTTEGQ
jgi:GxxExxY protein